MTSTDFVATRDNFEQYKLIARQCWRCLTVVESRGADAVRRIYLDTLKGRIPPEQGHMLSLLG